MTIAQNIMKIHLEIKTNLMEKIQVSYIQDSWKHVMNSLKVMNWFRVPMNVITCVALMSLNLEFFAHDKRIMFGICFILCLIGLLFQRSFKKLLAESKTGNSDHRTETVKLINDDSDDA